MSKDTYRSVEELNAAAVKLRGEQDLSGLLSLAQEYGVDEEDARDFMEDPEWEAFMMPLEAAAGRLNAEAEELNLKGILADWKDLLLAECAEDEDLCRRILAKPLSGCLAALIARAFATKERVPDEIVEQVKVKHNGKTVAMQKPLYLGVPSTAEACKVFRDYYEVPEKEEKGGEEE